MKKKCQEAEMSISFEVAAAAKVYGKPFNVTRDGGKAVEEITPKAKLLKYTEQTISRIPP